MRLSPTTMGAGLVVGVPPRYQSLSAIFSACFISAMAIILNSSRTATAFTPMTCTCCHMYWTLTWISRAIASLSSALSSSLTLVTGSKEVAISHPCQS